MIMKIMVAVFGIIVKQHLGKILPCCPSFHTPHKGSNNFLWNRFPLRLDEHIQQYWYLQISHLMCGHPPFFSVSVPHCGQFITSARLLLPTQRPSSSPSSCSEPLHFLPGWLYRHFLQISVLHFVHVIYFWFLKFLTSSTSSQPVIGQNIKFLLSYATRSLLQNLMYLA